MELRRSKIKCAHCQEVHHFRFDCDAIVALKTFAGHDKWQAKQNKKDARRKLKKGLNCEQ